MPDRVALRVLPLVSLVAAAACAPSLAPAPPPPSALREISVQAPANRTGSPLVVDEPGVIGRYLGESTSTVPELLAADLRNLLVDRGFRVLPAAAEGTPTLRTEIRRWVPYTADYSQVTVSLGASLVDPAGRTMWTLERNDWRVQTADARNAPEASATAAREIARALIAGWQPSSGPATATPPAPAP